MKKLPKNWVETTIPSLIGNNGLFSDGDWVESKDQDPNGEVRLIQLADVGVGNFRDRSDRFMNLDTADRLNCKYLNPDDVMVARMPDPIGRACIFPLDGKNVTVVDVAFIRVDSDIISNRLLMHFINSPQFNNRIVSLASGSTRQRISRKNLGSIPFPLPPRPEQQRIVAKLDSLFAALDQVKERMEIIPDRLKQFRQSVLTQAVTGKLTEEWREGKELEKWREVEVGEITDSIVPGRDKPKSFTGSIPWITTPNLTETYITSANANYFLSEEEIKLVRAKKIPVNSVIISIVGKFGVACIVKEVCVINQQLHAYLPSNHILPEYLMYSIWLLEDHMKSISTATTIAYINKTKANSLPINLPPLLEQTEIVNRIEALFSKADRIQEKYEALKAQIDMLPQAILAKAFKGELVEQLPTDGDARELLKEIAQLKTETGKKKRRTAR